MNETETMEKTMRKIYCWKGVNLNDRLTAGFVADLVPTLKIQIKNLDGTLTELLQELFEYNDASFSSNYLEKYSSEELEQIYLVNFALENNGYSKMSDEEVDRMFDPLGLNNLDEIKQVEDLQKLSGFVVEKVIKPWHGGSANV